MKHFGQNILLFIISILFTISSIHTISQQYKKLEPSTIPNLKELTETEYLEFSKAHNKYFIFFYVPWSTECQKVISVYNQASSRAIYNRMDVEFVLINSAVNTKLAKEWKVKNDNFPHIYWVDHDEGEQIEFDPDYTVEGFINFIKAHLHLHTKELRNYEALEKKKKNKKHFVFVGDIEKHWHNYKKFIKVSRMEEIGSIYWTKSQDFYSKFDIDPDSFDVIIFSTKNKTLNKGERFYLPQNTTSDEIGKLVEIYNRKVWGRIDKYCLLSALEVHSQIPTFLVVFNKTEHNFTELNNTLEPLAYANRKNYWILHTTNDSKFGSIITRVFNVTASQLPLIVLISEDPNNVNDANKYVMEPGTPITQTNIENFYLKFKAGELKQHIYSETIPEQKEDEYGITKVVGRTYNELVINNLGKDVVLFLCTSRNKKCKAGREIFARVATKLRGNPNLLLAEIDTNLNEFNYIHYEKLPEIALFPSHDTIDERISNIQLYSGQFITNNIIIWIKRGVKHQIKTINKLDSEETLFQQEIKKPINSISKEKVENYSSNNVGLRRRIIYEIDKPNDKDKKSNSRIKDDL